nr:hypothetical protein [Bacillus pumilus]
MQEWKGIKQDIQEVERKRARLMDETHNQAKRDEQDERANDF